MATPTRPIISPPECVIELEQDGYYTGEQSFTNVARRDKFKLVLDVPCRLKPFLKKDNRECNGGSLDRLEYSVWGYVVPEITVPKQEKAYEGQVFNYSSNSRPSYGGINIDFTVDNKFDNYYVLWKWLDIQNNSETGLSSAMTDYLTTITILALDENKEPVASWTFHDAFITTLGGMNHTTRDAGEMESSFTFEFSHLQMELI